MKPIPHAVLALCLLAGLPAHAQNADRTYLGYRNDNGTLDIATSDGRYLIRPYDANIVETSFVPRGETFDPASHAVVLKPGEAAATVKEADGRIQLVSDGITVTVEKSPLRISYAYKGRPLVAEKQGYGHAGELESIEFALEGDEALYGAGSRAVGMNRRGNRFRLYNRASYGFGNRADQMGYGIPMAVSSHKYALHFDNPQAGWLDFDSRKDGTLRYEVMGGRKTYQVIAGDDWAQLMDETTRLTGRQPLPPRWAFGNFASRFGYHTESQARAVVDQFIADGIPLDAIVFDLYWFGKTVKGTMGNLAWDRDSFPHPEAMMADFNRKGVKTVVITEPFVLTTSKRWQEAEQQGVLATDAQGKPFVFDFFFGNSGLVDVFKPQARDWFWNIYKDRVFQPIFRPHAQEEVPAEAIFRTPAVKALARDAIRLRYAMLPYNYTAAFDDSRTGMPMMRPVLFDDPCNEFMSTTAISSTYLWGPDFLVAPVTEPGATRKDVFFPRKGSVWFDFYTDEPHHGGILETVATRPDRIPTYIRAGAFIPLARPVQSTRDYSTAKLDLHYWHDAGVGQAAGHLYDDDGHSAHAYEAGKYELVRFASRFADGRLALTVAPEPGAAATPTTRTFDLKVHNVAARPRAVRAGGKAVAYRWDANRYLLDVKLPAVRTEALEVVVTL